MLPALRAIKPGEMVMAARGRVTTASTRKLIEFDAETWAAIRLLSRDTMKSIQELADEAFADLLRKHRRPVSLKEALRESARRLPANDQRPAGKPRRPARSD